MKTLIGFFLFIPLFIITSCNKEEDYTYQTTSINNVGFDFSAGATDYDFVTRNDGEIINWCPGGNENPDYETGLWWKNNSFQLKYEQKDMGIVELGSIKSIPDNWDSILNPLIEGHCYVIACIDRYAKFKVLSIHEINWIVKIEYYYSEPTSFGH